MHQITFSLCIAIGILSGFFHSADAFSPQQPLSEKTAASQTQADDGVVRFNFQESDWKDVIPWFAEQAGYSLQPINDWPQGTFFLKDDSDYTTLEALDQLNHSLRMRQPPFTLIRNRKMLILSRLEDANFPDELIETVDPAGLDERGKYETLNCIFELGELDSKEMFDEVKPIVDQATNRISVFPKANQIRIRASGAQLREVRELIMTARKRMVSDHLEMSVYRLKHMDAETFMIIARGLLDMEADQDASRDGSLTITREPLGDRLFLRGTEKMLERFQQVSDVIDVQPEQIIGMTVTKQSFKTYPILVDPKLGFDLLQTVLEGTGARMQQDETTGAITVLARKEEHQQVVAALEAISGQTGEDFAIIKVENGLASSIMLAVQSLLKQTTNEAGAVSGPVVMANSVLNQILVRGTPQEVAEVKRMVLELDANSVPVNTGPRTTTRIISMNSGEIDEIMPMVEPLLRMSGRPNSLNIVLPQERSNLKSRLRGLPDQPEKNLKPKPQLPSSETSSNFRMPSVNSSKTIPTSYNFVSFVSYQSDDQTESPATNTSRSQDYQPADQVPTVPGAPIEARFTEFGLVIISRDLDALDDLEQSIQSQLGTDSEQQLPTFFFLKHRKADRMKVFLEEYYGLVDTGGSDSGGGLMQGMMNNMLGGGTGDFLGGLLGGTGGGTSGSGELEGDVRFGMDVAFNAVYVAGATRNDLDQISDILDVLDQKEAPHNPELVGQFRTINIIHRDAMEVKTLVESQLADLIDTGGAAGASGQNNETQQLANMVKQLAGGKGGQSQVSEEDKPKVKLGVDTTTNQLLVTGPEFIYNEILKMVLELDKEELSNAPSVQIFQRQGDVEAIQSTLIAMFGDKIEILDQGDEADQEKKQANGQSNSGQRNGRNSNQSGRRQQEQARNAIMEAIQRQQRSQNGGGRGGRGRGGGGRQGRGGR